MSEKSAWIAAIATSWVQNERLLARTTLELENDMKMKGKNRSNKPSRFDKI